jgi:hypothetical protein
MVLLIPQLPLGSEQKQLMQEAERDSCFARNGIVGFIMSKEITVSLSGGRN